MLISLHKQATTASQWNANGPRTMANGMVERFNGRIEDPGLGPGQAVLQSHRFRSGEVLEQTILRYVRLYNGRRPQSVLKGRTPIDALKDCHRDRPELFRKRPYNHSGCDTQDSLTPLFKTDY